MTIIEHDFRTTCSDAKPVAPVTTDPTPSAGAIDTLMSEHRAALLGYVTRLTAGDRSWAEDVVQETFIRAWRHLDDLHNRPGSIRGWLLRVAHNLVIDGYRAAKIRFGVTADDVIERSPEPDRSEEVLDSLVVQRALTRLSTEQRRAIIETLIHDHTAAEAAAKLGVPVGTVKSRVYYALQRLRTDSTLLAAVG